MTEHEQNQSFLDRSLLMSVKETDDSPSVALAFCFFFFLLSDVRTRAGHYLICQKLIFWFPQSATVADQHLMGEAASEA